MIRIHLKTFIIDYATKIDTFFSRQQGEHLIYKKPKLVNYTLQTIPVNC